MRKWMELLLLLLLYEIYDLCSFPVFRVNENGIETVEVRENGNLTSRTIDGVPQLTSGGGNRKRVKH